MSKKSSPTNFHFHNSYNMQSFRLPEATTIGRTIDIIEKSVNIAICVDSQISLSAPFPLTPSLPEILPK